MTTILEITTQEHDLGSIPAQPVALMVHGPADVRRTINDLEASGASCACIAFVMPNLRRNRRRLALTLGLAQCHNRPCAVFEDRAEAERWLKQRLQPQPALH
ncbi:MAG: hypothetical protein OHK0046_00430 [Anaerolineae bacterium]